MATALFMGAVHRAWFANRFVNGNPMDSIENDAIINIVEVCTFTLASEAIAPDSVMTDLAKDSWEIILACKEVRALGKPKRSDLRATKTVFTDFTL
jgi:hypothetical protein